LSTKRAVLLGCLEEAQDTLQVLTSLGVKPDHIVGLPQAKAERLHVTNGVDMGTLATSLEVPYDEAQTYTMSQEADIDLFRRIAPDLLIVVSWQRLVPAEVLNLLGIAYSASTVPATSSPRDGDAHRSIGALSKVETALRCICLFSHRAWTPVTSLA
jgi:methionyl-tRNA formyltransferase